MSVSCYNPLLEDLENVSLRLFGTKNFLISKKQLKFYIFKYCQHKGIEDYGKYKDNIEDFYRYIENYLNFNKEWSKEIIDAVEEIKKAVPQINEEVPSDIIDQVMKNLNSIVEEDFEFKTVSLENGNFKIILPSNKNETSSVRFNKQFDEDLQLLQELSRIRKYRDLDYEGKYREVLNKLINYTHLGDFFLSLKDPEVDKRHIEKLRQLWRLPEGTFVFTKTKNGAVTRVTINNLLLQDYIKESKDIFEISKSLEEDVSEEVLDILNFLSTKTGQKYKAVTKNEAAELLGTDLKSIRKVNAFVKGDTCYFIKGRNLSTDIAAEEMLHPMVNAIKIQNKSLYDSLLKEAKEVFPKLHMQINIAYKGRPEEEIEEELVTQSLSRAFRVERRDNPRGRNVREFIKHFLQSIREFFLGSIGGLFNIDFVSIENIRPDTSIVDFVKIINSDINILYNNNDVIRFNTDTVEDLINRAIEASFSVKDDSQNAYIEFENFINRCKTKVLLHQDFEKNHSYTIDGKIADTSVTLFIRDPFHRNPKTSKNTTKIQKTASTATAVGNVVDEIVREFFIKEKMPANNKNMPKKAYNSLLDDLNKFKRCLDNSFPNGYKIYSEEFSVAGTISVLDKNDKAENITIVGTPDLVLVTPEGGVYIIDTKTSSTDRIGKESLENYKKQIDLYRNLIFSDLNNNAEGIFEYKGGYVLQCNMSYLENTEFTKNEQGLYVDSTGTPLSSYMENLKNPYIVQHKDTSIGYLLDANGDFTHTVKTINAAYNMLSVSKQDLKEAAKELNIPQQEIEKEVKRSAQIIKEAVESSKNTPSKAFSITLEDAPLTASELSKIGKSLIKTFSYAINIISQDPEFLKYLKIDLKEDITGMPTDKIIKEYFEQLRVPILDYIKKNFFNIGNLKREDPRYIKFKYVKQHIEEIFNRSFAEFREVENINIKVNTISDQFEDSSKIQLEDVEEDGREPYFIDKSEKSYIESIPSRLKRELALIPIIEQDDSGNAIYENGMPRLKISSETMLPRFEEKVDVINTLFEELHDYRTSTEMMEFLEKSSEKWKKYLYGRLKNNPRMQTIFFRTFRKSKTNYYSTTNNKNRRVQFLEDKSIKAFYMDSVYTYENSMFSGVKYRTSLFTNANSQGNIKVNETKLKALNNELVSNGRNLTKAFSLKALLKTLQLPDFKIPQRENDRKLIVLALQDFYSSINRILKDSSDSYITSRDFETIYNSLINILLPYTTKNYELMVYDLGKSYAVYTEPTFIQDVVEDFASGRFKEKVQGNPQNWQFCNQNSEKFINSWYEDYRKGSKKSRMKYMKHLKKTSSIGITYADMNSHQYLRSIIQDYFCTSQTGFFSAAPESDKMAIFRVPIESDKPSQESILFYKIASINKNDKKDYGVVKMKEEISKKAFLYFILDIERMKRLLNTPKSSIAKIARYDADHDNSIVKNISLKLQEGTLILSDFIDSRTGNLHEVLLNSGVNFAFLSEFNSEIFNSNEDKNSVIKLLFIEYIQKEENDDSTLAKKLELAFELLFISVMDSLYRMFLEEYYNPALKDSEYKKSYIDQFGKRVVETKDFSDDIIPGETVLLKDAYLQEFFYNDYIATLNILNMTVVDPAFFKDTIDLQKRFALVHSSTVKPDINAQYAPGKYYSDGKHRVLILKDFISPSEIKNNVLKIFNNKLHDAELEYNKENTKETALKINLYKNIIKDVEKLYDGDIVSTDGLAFSTPTGAWKKRGMLGEDIAEQFKFVLDSIRKGDYLDLKNLTEMSLVFKSFTASIILDPGDPTTFKPVQFKDSEAMLLAIGLMKQEDVKHPLLAVYEFLEDSHYDSDTHNDDTYIPSGIDLVVFESAVKEGSSHALDLQGMDYTQVKQTLNDLAHKYIHVHSFDEWGQQQNVPQHYYQDSVDLGSQVRILPVADLPLDFQIELFINGENQTFSKEEFLQYYMNLLKLDFEIGIEKVRDVFKTEFGNVEQANALKQLLLDSIMRDSNQNIISLDIANRHGFDNSMVGDPAVANKAYSMIFTKIKNAVNKQNFLGGSVVLVSEVAANEKLQVRDSEGRSPEEEGFDLSLGGMTMDIAIVPSDPALNQAIRYDSKKHAKLLNSLNIQHYYKQGDIMKVKDLLSLGIVTEEDLKLLAYRIPTEDKYSVFRCRIAEFLPLNSGEQIILPKEGVLLSGFDYDIDKLYCIKKYTKTENANESRKNAIFDCLWAVMGHPSTIEKQLHPGDFGILKNLAKTLNPKAQKVGNIANITTLIQLHNSNTAGKKFVGIAALNNISHAISNFAELRMHPLLNRYKISGVFTDYLNSLEGFLADQINSPIDGSRISRTLGMFVGASADNAKEAVLGKLNITPTTANLSMAMIRMGIPIEIIAGIMNLPEIKEMSVNKSSFQFTEELLNYKSEDVNTADIDITLEDLINMINGKENKEVLNAVIYLLKEINTVALGYNRLNNITSLNSTKNSVGPTPFEVYKKLAQIERFNEEFEFSDKNIGIFTDSLKSLYEKVPFLKPLKDCYELLVFETCKEWSPLFSNTFRNIMHFFTHDVFIPIEAFTPDLFKTIANSFLVFNTLNHTGMDAKDIFESTVKEVLEYKQKESRESNAFIDRLQILNIKDQSKYKEIVLRTTNLNQAEKEDIAAAWEDFSRKNQELSKKILSYFIVTLGFYWTPISPITLGTYNVKLGIDNYNSIFTDFEGFNQERFLKLLFGNLTVFSKIWTPYSGKFTEIKDGIIIKKEDLNNYTYFIKKDDGFYVKKEESDIEHIFVKIEPLGLLNKLFEFNPFQDIEKSMIKEGIQEGRGDADSGMLENTIDPKDSLDTVLDTFTESVLKKFKKAKTENSQTTAESYYEENKEKLKSRVLKFYSDLDIEYDDAELEEKLDTLKNKIKNYCL